jgi:hypothetical protein
VADISTSAPNPAGVSYPKDYALINLTLLSAADSMDMKNLLTELSYQEDLFNNTASGYLMVVDSMGYIETLNLTGNEYLRMTFGKTNQDSNWIDKIFRVYKVDKRRPEGKGDTESYQLYFCSEEMLLSEQYKVSKSYRAKAISDNVIDILQNYLNVNDKRIGTIEPTYGIYDFIIPTIKPFDAINWMAVYARPTPDKPGSDMLFYENKFGFNFRSIQSMMKEPVYHNYSYDPKNIDNQTYDLNKRVYNVTTYEILNSYDALGAINSGIFANKLISVDPVTRRYKETTFDYAAYIKQAEMLNKYPITNSFKNRFGDGVNQTPEAVTKLVFSNFKQNQVPYIASQGPDSVGKDIYAETYIPYRTAQLALANYTRVKISVPGDPGLTVGTNINFSLLSKNPNNKEPDPFYSGNYLITAVRHMITMNEYKTVLEITKESTTKQYASPDNGSALWQNTVRGIT